MRGFVEPKVTGGRFGLNQNAKITKFDIKKSDDNKVFVQLTFDINGKEYYVTIFEITRAWDYENNQWTEDKNSKFFQREEERLALWFQQLALAYAPIDIVKKTLNKEFKTYAEYFKTIKLIVGKNKDKAVDIFLQWQLKPKGNYKKTFLEIPQLRDISAFELWISPHVEGSFIEKRTEMSLEYITKDGIKHPISRGTYFLKSNKAKQQIIESDDDDMNFDNNSFGGVSNDKPTQNISQEEIKKPDVDNIDTDDFFNDNEEELPF
jgi:hypothetical protein